MTFTLLINTNSFVSGTGSFGPTTSLWDIIFKATMVLFRVSQSKILTHFHYLGRKPDKKVSSLTNRNKQKTNFTIFTRKGRKLTALFIILVIFIERKTQRLPQWKTERSSNFTPRHRISGSYLGVQNLHQNLNTEE